MHLFKHFFKMISKYKNTIFLYAIIFIVMMSAFVMNGGFTTESGTGVEDKSFTIGYIDNSDSEVSEGLLEYLKVNNELIDLEDKSEDSIKTMVFFTTIDMQINIDENFEEKIEAGDDSAVTFTSASDNGPSSYLIESMINNYISTYEIYTKLGYGPSEAASLTKENLSLNADTYVLTKDSDNKADNQGRLFTVCYMAKFFVYISFSVICQCVGLVIIKNNQSRVDSRIKVSPVSTVSQSVANVLGLFVCGIVVWVIACILIFVSGVGLAVVSEYGYVLALILLAMCICNCAMTSFIASFPIASDALPMITNIVSLAMSFMCGVFVPQAIMNPGVVELSRFLPFYWSIVVLDSINPVTGSIADYSPKLLITSLLMLMLFSAIFVVAGIVVKRTQTYSKVR